METYKVLYHATETPPDKLKSEGLKPGYDNCLETLMNFIIEALKINKPEALKIVPDMFRRCEESRDVYLSKTKEFALQNCHAASENKFEYDEALGKETIGAPGDTDYPEKIKKYIQNHPCYLCNVEIPKAMFDELFTHHGEGIYPELTFSHIPPKFIKACVLVPTEKDLAAWLKGF